MPKQANGTHAKDIAIHFLDLTTDGRYTPSVVARTINTAKSLLKSGYTKEEIISCIDYAVNVKRVKMYSIGYISVTIHDLIKEVQKLQAKQRIKVTEFTERSAEQVDEESSKRNREKAQRNSLQSRFGKKFNFDMLKEQ